MSQRDLTTTFAENILKQIENEEPIDSKSKLHETLNATDAINNNNNQRAIKSPTIKCEATSTSTQQALLSKHEIKSEPVIKIEKLVEFDSKVEFTNKMTAKEIYDTVK